MITIGGLMEETFESGLTCRLETITDIPIVFGSLLNKAIIGP